MQNESVMLLDIHLSSPVIILPFKVEQSIQEETWVVNLGDLSIKSDEKMLDPAIKDEEKAVDMYKIKLQNMNMVYYESI